MALVALIWAVSVLWLVVSLLRALFPSRRRSGLRQAGWACVLFFASFAGVLALDDRDIVAETATKDTSTREKLLPAPAGPLPPARQNAEDAESLRQQAEKRQAAEDYVQVLQRELEGIPKFSPRDYADTVDSLSVALALPQAWTMIYEEGRSRELSVEQETVRQRFRKAISKRQTEILPVLRDLYGPAMRKELWEADGKARTFSAGFRTVEFISGAFAANRNIKKTHEMMHATLMMFRFTRAQYKWVDADVEYSYYTLDSPKDGEVGIWTGGRFRPVE